MPPIDPVLRDVIHHRPPEGTLAWGGPEHGKVHDLGGRTRMEVFRFPLPSRLAGRRFDEPTATIGPISTVSYTMHRVGTRCGAVGEDWLVLIYQENEARLMKNLKATVDFLLWLCRFMPGGEGTDG